MTVFDFAGRYDPHVAVEPKRHTPPHASTVRVVSDRRVTATGFVVIERQV